jgi:hypothetical protein
MLNFSLLYLTMLTLLGTDLSLRTACLIRTPLRVRLRTNSRPSVPILLRLPLNEPRSHSLECRLFGLRKRLQDQLLCPALNTNLFLATHSAVGPREFSHQECLPRALACLILVVLLCLHSLLRLLVSRLHLNIRLRKPSTHWLILSTVLSLCTRLPTLAVQPTRRLEWTCPAR